MRLIKIAASISLLTISAGLLIWVFAPKARASSIPVTSSSADGIWEKLDPRTLTPADRRSADSSSPRLRLNKDALTRQLAGAPLEGGAKLRHSPAIVSLPMPDGSFQRFHIEQSPIMEPSLAARLPEIKTYRGQAMDDPSMTARFDWTPQGLHALILLPRDSVYVEPSSQRDGNYVSHGSQRLPGEVFHCGVTEADVAEAAARGVYSQPASQSGVTPEVANGTSLRTYRLAIAATGEWTTQYGGGTVNGAQSSIATMVNLIDAIYEKEVAIRFTLVNNTNIIFTNAATDPYASPNAADSAALNANEATLDNNALLGSANYDIGHVFGSGAGFFSGLAQLGVTCNAGSKAKGVSTMSGGSITTSTFIGGIAHEIGHQFSATHSFNATTGSFCSGQRDGANAYEVGGGSTIMSYQVCETENLQPQGDNYFYVRSLEQIVNYATNNALCAATGATGNTVPTVTGPGNFTIPANTPFQLTAKANDPNGSLTYSWEEYDLGTAGPPNTDNGSRPIFRGYKPTTSPSRTFPSLQYILNNANVPPTSYNGGCFDNSGNPILCLTGESLPTTNRTMNFQVVVRDNQANGGAINTATSVLTVVNTAGPFTVTAPNGGESWSGTQNVTWNAANTNTAPINTANVKISLSTNGGLTFPTVLAASVPNTGSASVALPNGVASSTCRIKVEAIGNVFFDISNANFALAPADGCPAATDFSPKAASAGTAITITGVNLNGVTAVTFSNNVPATSFTVNSATSITATVSNGAVGGPITLTKPGCGNFQIVNNLSVCPGAPVTLSIDDGSVNTAYQFNSGAYYVNRLTPASYPATLTQVSILWASFQSFPAGTPINIVAGANTGGGTNIDGISLQSVAATSGPASAGGGSFTTYTLPNPVTITAGDFVVGFQVPTEPNNSFPIAVDTDTTLNRSYTSTNGGANFSTFTSGNFMIRAAQVFINCDAGTPTLKILSIAHATNGHITLQAVGVPNLVNNLQASPDLSLNSFMTLAPPPEAADGFGLFLYDDPDATGLTKRFYRLQFP